MSKYYVYLHKKATDGTPFYVGKGSGKRAHAHHNRSALWHNIVEKHGFEVELVKEGLEEEEAFQLECDLIAQYGRKDSGKGMLANHTDGGDGVRGAIITDRLRAIYAENTNRLKMDPAYKAAHSAGLKKAWQNDTARKEKHSAQMKARYSEPGYKEAVAAKISAAHSTPEAKAARSEMAKKYQSDPAVKAASSARMKARLEDPKFRANIAAGMAASWKTTERKEAHIARMKAAHADPTSAQSARYKKVLCVETGIVYPSFRAAARAASPKGTDSAIRAVCKGQRKKAYGFSWAFVEQKETT